MSSGAARDQLSVRAFLRRIDLFAGLSEDELGNVERCIERPSTQDGERIVKEGEASEQLYIHEAGEVEVFRHVGESDNRREVLLAALGPGECFGERSLLDDLPPSAAVRREGAYELLTIGRLDLDVLLNWDTILAAKMWRSFARMLSRRDTNATPKTACSPASSLETSNRGSFWLAPRAANERAARWT